jgi:hypothetical protein
MNHRNYFQLHPSIPLHNRCEIPIPSCKCDIHRLDGVEPRYRGLATTILDFLQAKENFQTNGIDISVIAQAVNIKKEDKFLREVLDALTGEGLAYYTFDDDHILAV